jgi:hypothetical protein
MERSKSAVTAETVLGGVLVVMGIVLLLDKLDIVAIRELVKLWPVSLIGVGIYQLLEYKEKSRVQ